LIFSLNLLGLDDRIVAANLHLNSLAVAYLNVSYPSLEITVKKIIALTHHHRALLIRGFVGLGFIQQPTLTDPQVLVFDVTPLGYRGPPQHVQSYDVPGAMEALTPSLTEIGLAIYPSS
jgi:hypothetical protein